MLVAFCPKPSDKHSTSPGYRATNFNSADGSYNAFYAYIDKKSRETNTRATGEGSTITTGCHKEKARRVKKRRVIF
jgi:hypothetical protein